jgi:flagellar biosynthesis protein FlhB
MSEELADRTNPATPRRREQFRREGKVARSADLTAATVMIGCLLLLAATAAHLASSIEALLKSSLTLSVTTDTTATLRQATGSALLALAPILLGVFLLAIIAVLIQIGRPILFHRPPRSARIGRPQRPLLWLLASSAKLLVLAFVTWRLILSRLGSFLSPGPFETRHFFASACQTLFAVTLQIALVLLAFGVLDYAIQRFRLERQLKMTRRELNDELRQTEGDPRIKMRRRKLRTTLTKAHV